MRRTSLTFVVSFSVAIALGPALGGVQGSPPIKASPVQAGAQSVQYRSPAGVEYRSLADSEAVTKAQAALAS